jgi:hypothetical protein
MIENKPVFLTTTVSDINLYHKDYELVQLYTETYSSIQHQSTTILGAQAYLPVAVMYSTTYALMKLRRTQEILYGEKVNENSR